jgi:tetratricopeptide (TPR) repeat protein
MARATYFSCFQVMGKPREAIVAYEKAAEANVRGNGTAWHAGKHLEAAAQLSKNIQDWPASAEFARQAASHYVDAGKIGTGAECLGRAARWVEEASPNTAGKLYVEATDLYGQDPMSSMAHDIVQRGVGLQLKAGKWEDAATMLMHWASICSSNKSFPNICRAYLGKRAFSCY